MSKRGKLTNQIDAMSFWSIRHLLIEIMEVAVKCGTANKGAAAQRDELRNLVALRDAALSGARRHGLKLTQGDEHGIGVIESLGHDQHQEANC